MSIAIVVPTFELDLDRILLSGQTFRWQRDDDGWWVSPVGGGTDVLRLRRVGDDLLVDSKDPSVEQLVKEYFHLDKSLRSMRDRWRAAGEVALSTSIDNAPGLRIVRQDPVECLFSFLCSSAAPIHRIRRSVNGLSKLLGRDLGVVNGVNLYAFPDLESLALVPRAEMDRLGLGFRGRYVNDAARMILAKGGREWLLGMRGASYADAKAALITLPGVGEKVADCVCLFSLDKHEAVPIDVHMARVARREFEECHPYKALTAKAYEAYSSCFRQRYGEVAGWAQQYFFYAEIERRGLWDQELGRHRPKPASSQAII